MRQALTAGSNCCLESTVKYKEAVLKVFLFQSGALAIDPLGYSSLKHSTTATRSAMRHLKVTAITPKLGSPLSRAPFLSQKYFRDR